MVILTLEGDSIVHVRSIYTVWDVLGDIGGLIDMLRFMVQPLVIGANFIFGSGLTRYLLGNLFLT